MVIDMLNMSQHTKLQKASFGGKSSEQIDDYEGLDEQIDTPRGQALRKIVDPWEYRERLTQPKLVILGTNDRYWPLDACNLYWDDLQGEKYLIYVPNNGHGLPDRVADRRRPERTQPAASSPASRCRSWSGSFNEWRRRTCSSNVDSDVRPSRVRVWTATAATRDFRDSKWTAADAQPAADAVFMHQLPLPAEGYAALFGEACFTKGPRQRVLAEHERADRSQQERGGRRANERRANSPPIDRRSRPGRVARRRPDSRAR